MDTWKSEELIKEFYRAQCASGMGTKVAARHRDKLRFFLHAYVAEQWPRDIDRIDSDIIRDFLGAWFIRHVGGKKADLNTYLATFNRFYEYLYQTGHISEAEYDDLITVCQNRDYFMACYDEYMNPFPDFDGLSVVPTQPLDHKSVPRRPGSGLDYQLWILVHNLERPPAPALLDFSLYLDYLACGPIKLTKAKRVPTRYLRRINRRFTSPEQLASRAGMDSCRRINWFFHLALDLDLARINCTNELEPTPGTEIFLDLAADTKLAIIIDATWNRISWAELGNKESRRVSKWAQEHRDGFAALLADLPPDQETPLDPDSETDRQETLLARYVLFHEVVDNFIIFSLKETGVLDYLNSTIEQSGTLRTTSITMSRLGRRIMGLFTRRVKELGKTEQSPLAQLQESLLL